MLMGTPSIRDTTEIKRVLDDFMEASGTSINQEKSHVFFFNTLVSVQFNISRILGFRKSPFRPNIWGFHFWRTLLEIIIGRIF
jgi:hypothetical protein